MKVGGVSPTSRKNDKLGLTTIEGDLVGKKPTVQQFQVNIHSFLHLLGGVANVEEIGVIREVIHTTILDRAIKIIDVNQKKEGAKYRTLGDSMGLRECGRIKS